MGEAKFGSPLLNTIKVERNSSISFVPQASHVVNRQFEAQKASLNELLKRTKAEDNITGVPVEKPIYLDQTPYNLSEKVNSGYTLKRMKGSWTEVTYNFTTDLKCSSINERNTRDDNVKVILDTPSLADAEQLFSNLIKHGRVGK